MGIPLLINKSNTSLTKHDLEKSIICKTVNCFDTKREVPVASPWYLSAIMFQISRIINSLLISRVIQPGRTVCGFAVIKGLIEVVLYCRNSKCLHPSLVLNITAALTPILEKKGAI